jgi:microcystin-dependent protein
MAFSAVTITNQGLQAINTILSTGGTLAFTGADGGSGYPTGTDDPKTFTALKNHVMPATPTSANNTVLYQSTYKINFSSANAPSQFQLNEIGIWYSLNGGTAFLFGYSTTGGATGDIITPTSSTNAVEKDYVIPIVYSQSVPVSTSAPLTGTTELHASTHLPSGTDPIPISSSTIGGLTPKTNANPAQVLVGSATAAWGAIPLHAPTHLDTGTDPIPVSATTHTGLLPRLSGNADQRLDGTGAWNASHPAGVVLDYAGPNPPSGWLMCDGQAYLQTQYPALFAAIGGYYGWSGAYGGNNTFNVPDCRGRATVGAGAGPGLTNRGLNAKGGEENHVLSTNELASHNHPISDPTHAHGVGDPGHTHSLAQNPHTHSMGDPGHAHPLVDPGHAHSTYDPAHYHAYVNPIGEGLYINLNAPGYGDQIYGPLGGTNTSTNPTGIAIYASGTGCWINTGYTGVFTWGANASLGVYAAATGLGIYGAGTGISVQYSGGSWGHNTMMPFIALNKIIKT